jgi:RES domain/HEPN/RES N-terminal domain 1
MGMAKRALEDEIERGFRSVPGGICVDHIADAALRTRLQPRTSGHECIFCGRTSGTEEIAFTVALNDLLEEVMVVARYFYDEASNTGIWDAEDGSYYAPGVVETDDVVADVCADAFEPEVSDEVCDTIVRAIGFDRQWSAEGARGSSIPQTFQWARFSRQVKEVSRFIFLTSRSGDGSEPTSFLFELLSYLDKELGLMSSLPAGTRLYRGRLVKHPGDVERTAAALGPAPLEKAAANRFSAPGISLFYGSEDAQTAVAEIAGHGPDPLAVVGRFETRRPLRILDFTRRPKVPSIFDRERRRQGEMARFLEAFIADVTRPIVPDGLVHIEYAPTQVVTEFLRWFPEIHIDGFALPSAQTHRRTYILFLGPMDVADEDIDGRTTRSDAVSSLFDDDPDPSAIVLPLGAAQTFEVIRTYDARPAEAYESFGSDASIF